MSKHSKAHGALNRRAMQKCLSQVSSIREITEMFERFKNRFRSRVLYNAAICRYGSIRTAREPLRFQPWSGDAIRGVSS